MIGLLSAIAGFAQTGKVRPTAVKPAPPATTGAGVGGSNGSGVGATNGSGIGAPSGGGVGAASGSSLSTGRSSGVIVLPSTSSVFRTRRPNINATDIKVGNGVGVGTRNGVAAPADTTSSGTGEATGTGVGNESESRPFFTPKRDYIKEMNGDCFYVTSLGYKVYVARSKCSIE